MIKSFHAVMSWGCTADGAGARHDMTRGTAACESTGGQAQGIVSVPRQQWQSCGPAQSHPACARSAKGTHHQSHACTPRAAKGKGGPRQWSTQSPAASPRSPAAQGTQKISFENSTQHWCLRPLKVGQWPIHILMTVQCALPRPAPAPGGEAFGRELVIVAVGSWEIPRSPTVLPTWGAGCSQSISRVWALPV